MLVRAWLLLSLASPSLRVFGFTRTQDALGSGPRREAGCHDLARARVIARLVQAAANRNPFRPNCLARSIVLAGLLRRQGLAAELRIGVAKPGGSFAAHAWVEHDGVALAEVDVSRRCYSAFDEVVPTR